MRNLIIAVTFIMFGSMGIFSAKAEDNIDIRLFNLIGTIYDKPDPKTQPPVPQDLVILFNQEESFMISRSKLKTGDIYKDKSGYIRKVAEDGRDWYADINNRGHWCRTFDGSIPISASKNLPSQPIVPSFTPIETNFLRN